MARQLRARTSRVDYAHLAKYGNTAPEASDGESEASVVAMVVDEDSGSDFAPGAKNKESKEEESEGEGDSDEDVAMDEDEEDMNATEKLKKRPRVSLASGSTSVVQTQAKVGKSKVKTSTFASGIQASFSSGPSLGGATSRKSNTALSTPSLHHRHRAVPIFIRTGSVERLTARPSLFEEPKTVLTNCFTSSIKISDRVSKAWGHNIGAGPLWELVEDRGWFKESGDDLSWERNRRPLVYEDLAIGSSWKTLEASDATVYLPSGILADENGQLQPPSPIACLFGPLKSQKRVETIMFDSLNMADYVPGSKAFVLNAGGPVWAMDWCPFHADERSTRQRKQYLALSPFPSSSHSPFIGEKCSRPSNSSIQLWSFSPEGLRCKFVVCHESGPAFELKWCPLPSHGKAANGAARLGLLGGIFEDGSFSVYSIPDPDGLFKEDSDSPKFIHLPAPILRIELDESPCFTFDWANSELVVIGTTTGVAIVYDIGAALKNYNGTSVVENLLPMHYIPVHQSAIRSIAWLRTPPCDSSGEYQIHEDPTFFVSAGYDGVQCITDVREGHGTAMGRTRDVINAVAVSPYGGGPITVDHENMVKSYSAAPSMLGRGHSLTDPRGPVWSLGASDWHPQLAVSSADGSVTTTNMLRSTRKGGGMPFFTHKIFQMDYSRDTKEYRMLENFYPTEIIDRASQVKNSKASSSAPPAAKGTGAWPPQMGVHKVIWNNSNGPESVGTLASATASGLVRVDTEIWGKWVRGKKLPYGGIEGIRMEQGASDTELESDEDEG